jgi:hypothetical protein
MGKDGEQPAASGERKETANSEWYRPHPALSQRERDPRGDVRGHPVYLLRGHPAGLVRGHPRSARCWTSTCRHAFANTHRACGHPARLRTPTACSCCACGHPTGFVRALPHPRVAATGSQHGDRNRWAHGLPPARGQAEETQPVAPTAASHRSDSLSRIHEAAAPRSAYSVRAPLGDQPHDAGSPSAAGREPGPRWSCGVGVCAEGTEGQDRGDASGGRTYLRSSGTRVVSSRVSSDGLERSRVGFAHAVALGSEGSTCGGPGTRSERDRWKPAPPRGPRRANLTRWS